MARTNPLGKIKDLTVETLRSPRSAAGKAVGQARGAAATGVAVTGQLTRTAASTALKVSGALTSHARRPADAAARAAGAGRTDAATATPTAPTSAPEPVNVVEELGLDPAPVEASGPAAGEVPAPTTSIDAAADPDAVDVTPADVAPQVARRAPARSGGGSTAPKQARKKPAAKKSAPGDKLPPRRRTEDAAQG